MCEVTDQPPVAIIDQVDEDAVEEKADYDQAGTVVPAAFHYGVHLSLSRSLSLSVYC